MRNFRQEPKAAEARKKAGELYHAFHVLLPRRELDLSPVARS